MDYLNTDHISEYNKKNYKIQITETKLFEAAISSNKIWDIKLNQIIQVIKKHSFKEHN